MMYPGNTPGQRITRHDTPASESKLVRAQWLLATLIAELVYAAAVLTVVLVGRRVFQIVVGVGLVLALLAWIAQQDDLQRRAIGALLAVTVGGAWWAVGDLVALWAWAHALRIVATGAVLVFIAVGVFPIWRLLVELVNPNWPPPLNPREAANGGVGWPGTTYYDPNQPDPDIIEVEREIPRIVPVSGRIARGPARSIQYNGQRIQWRDLATFNQRGRAVGATWSAWQDMWTLEQWQGVVDYLADLGIVTERAPRKTTEFLVSEAEAANILRAADRQVRGLS